MSGLQSRFRGLFLAALLPLVACESRRVTPIVVEDAAPSPNASIYPSPLAPLTPTTEAPAGGSSAARASTAAPRSSSRSTTISPPRPQNPLLAGSTTARPASSMPQTPVPVALALRSDEAPAADTTGAKDGLGVALVAEWRWPDVGAPPARPEVNVDAIAALKKQLALRWTIALTESGRLRATFDARSFPVPAGSELRARAESLGHVFVYPSGDAYRVAAPGSLRALFNDHRLDVAPLVAGTETKARSTLPSRFGATVERVELTSRVGTVTLELAHVPEAGVGALLLCRTLLELAAIDPRSAVCERELLPVRAHLAWPSGAGVVFEVLELKRRGDLPLAELLVPPPGSALKDAALPSAPSGLLLSREEAATFRTRSIDVGPPTVAPGGRPPLEGLLLRNATDQIRYVTIDGAPVAYVLPGTEQAVTGLQKGRYNVQWRTFLGDTAEPITLVDVPGRSAIGVPVEAFPAPVTSAK